MAANLDKPSRWKSDIADSVDLYNAWFMEFAPEAFRRARRSTAGSVTAALDATADLLSLTADALRTHPAALRTLRLSTAPPLAADRLSGLAGVPRSMVNRMEKQDALPQRMMPAELESNLNKLAAVVGRMADRDLFVWLEADRAPSAAERERAIAVVSDRVSGATADPVIRNAQESRQLLLLNTWLEERGYLEIPSDQRFALDDMEPGSFRLRASIPISQQGGRQVNIPVDVAVMPKEAGRRDFPVVIEAKSAGDFANVNKRRKEEAAKAAQLRDTYGRGISFVLFLCGYFDSGYLGYEAAEESTGYGNTAPTISPSWDCRPCCQSPTVKWNVC